MCSTVEETISPSRSVFEFLISRQLSVVTFLALLYLSKHLGLHVSLLVRDSIQYALKKYGTLELSHIFCIDQKRVQSL
jgi:hypothetical protein